MRNDRIAGRILAAVLLLAMLCAATASALTWGIEAVDRVKSSDHGDYGGYPSLAVDLAGNPHIGYYNKVTDTMRYASWTDGWSIETVSAVGKITEFVSLKLDGADSPHVSYFNRTLGDLRYAWRDGTGWHETSVDTDATSGWTFALALNRTGYPRIAYGMYDSLKYAAFDGVHWEIETLVASGAYEPSIAVDPVTDLPSIAYRQGNSLRYLAYDGTAWNAEEVDSAGTVGYWPSLAFDSAGNPGIAHTDITTGGNYQLKYSWNDGSTWHSEFADRNGHCGWWPSLARDPATGYPRISHYDARTGELRYVGYNGTEWSSEAVYTSRGNWYWYSLALDGAGKPRLAFLDDNEGTLDYAQAPPLPSAEFMAYPTRGTAPLTVWFVSHPWTSITGRAWDFNNDGIVDSTEENPVHVYGAGGTYTARLTVTGPQGTESRTMTITVSPAPSSSFAAYPESGTAPLSVRFFDYTPNVRSRVWDFGDNGTSTEQYPVHIYNQSGLYTVSLTATNWSGYVLTKTQYHLIRVTDPVTPAPTPVADFSANATAGAAPMTVAFTDASSPAPYHRWWTFGDGSSSTDATPVHTYTKAGTYTVNLSVWTGIGQATVSKPAYITVGADPRAPVANFTMSVTGGRVPFIVRLKDTSTGTPTSWHWEIPNHGWTTAQNPLVYARSPGTYAVTLTATNEYGSSNMTKTFTATRSALRAAKGDAVSFVG